MEEEWKEIKGYPDYLISNHGRVKSFKYDKEDGRILKPHISTRGYSQVNLWDETRKRTIQYNHRLTLQAFIGECPEGKEANHKDGDKTNNTANNLEWVSHSKNLEHAYRLGLRHGYALKGEASPQAKLTERDVRIIRYLYKETSLSQWKIGKIFGVTQITIFRIVNRKTWRHI